MTVRIGHQISTKQLYGIRFLGKQGFVDMYGDHFGKEEIMRTHRDDLRDLTFQIHRRFLNHRGIDLGGADWGKSGFHKLVVLFARTNATPVGKWGQLFVYQIDNK